MARPGVIETYRQRGSVVSGVLGSLVSGALGVFSLPSVFAGRNTVYVSATLLGAAVFWVLLVRPSVRVRDGGVEIDNPFRATMIPWGAVEGFASKWNLQVWAEDKVYSAWGIANGAERPQRSSLLSLASAGRVAEAAPSARRPKVTTGAVKAELERYHAEWSARQPAAVAQQPSGEAVPEHVTKRWSRLDAALVGVPLAALIVALLAR